MGITHVKLPAMEQSVLRQKSRGQQTTWKALEQLSNVPLNPWWDGRRVFSWRNDTARRVAQVPQNVASVLVVPATHLPERVILLADEIGDVPGRLVRGSVQQDVALAQGFNHHHTWHRAGLNI